MDLTGKILVDSFNGMSDYFLVINDNDKTVWLKQLELEFCTPKEPNDPLHRTLKLKKNSDGSYITFGKEIMKRKNGNKIRGPVYGGYMTIEENPDDEITMYWG